MKSFYSTLYKKRNDKTETDCYNYLKTLKLPRLTDDESRLCKGELTKRECWEALPTMGNNKSPGNDGLSKEFYVFSLTKSIASSKYVFSRRAVLHSQRQVVMVLIEKRTWTNAFSKARGEGGTHDIFGRGCATIKSLYRPFLEFLTKKLDPFRNFCA